MSWRMSNRLSVLPSCNGLLLFQPALVRNNQLMSKNLSRSVNNCIAYIRVSIDDISIVKQFCQQRGWEVKGVVFTTILIAWSGFLRRFWSHDLGSTRLLVSLLRLWIRYCTMIISAWWLQTSSKFTWEEGKRQPQSLDYGLLQSGRGLVQNKSATAASSWVEDKYGSINITVTSSMFHPIYSNKMWPWTSEIVFISTS